MVNSLWSRQCVEISYILWCHSITSYAGATTCGHNLCHNLPTWRVVNGGRVMWGPCGDTFPPFTTCHVGKLWHKLWYQHNSSRTGFRLSLTSVQSWRKRSVLRHPMNESHVVILQKNQYTSAHTIITHLILQPSSHTTR